METSYDDSYEKLYYSLVSCDSKKPPLLVLRTLASLGVDHSWTVTADRATGENKTEWHVLAVAERRLCFVSARSPLDDWHGENDHDTQATLVAGTRPLASLTGLDVESIEDLASGLAGSRSKDRWAVVWHLRLRGESDLRIRLPPYPIPTEYEHEGRRGRVESIAKTLLDRIGSD